MKISIKLANGIEITREFTAEQLQKYEIYYSASW